MTTQSPEPDQRKRSVAEELRRIRRIGFIMLAAIIVVGGGALIFAARNANEIDKRERVDRDALRSAAWRGCARDMLERADQYISQQISLKSPLIRRAFPPEIIEGAVERRRRTLPIFNCDPNLCGDQPTVLEPKMQKRYIKHYARAQLAANPEPPKPSKWPLCPVSVTSVPIQLSPLDSR